MPRLQGPSSGLEVPSPVNCCDVKKLQIRFLSRRTEGRDLNEGACIALQEGNGGLVAIK